MSWNGPHVARGRRCTYERALIGVVLTLLAAGCRAPHQEASDAGNPAEEAERAWKMDPETEAGVPPLLASACARLAPPASSATAWSDPRFAVTPPDVMSGAFWYGREFCQAQDHRLLLAHYKRMPAVWDLETSTVLPLTGRRAPRWTGDAIDAAVWPEGSADIHLLTCSFSGPEAGDGADTPRAVTTFDARTGRLVRRTGLQGGVFKSPCQPCRDSSELNCERFALSPDASVVAGLRRAAYDPLRDGKRPGMLRMWDVRTGKQRFELAPPEGLVAFDDLEFSPDGSALAVSSMHGVTVLSTATGTSVAAWTPQDATRSARVAWVSPTRLAWVFDGPGPTVLDWFELDQKLPAGRMTLPLGARVVGSSPEWLALSDGSILDASGKPLFTVALDLPSRSACVPRHKQWVASLVHGGVLLQRTSDSLRVRVDHVKAGLAWHRGEQRVDPALRSAFLAGEALPAP